MLEKLIDVIAYSKRHSPQAIVGDLKYADKHNFMGRIAAGYQPEAKDVCLLAIEAGKALSQVQTYLNQHHQLGLIIHDAYRPLRSVKDFATWSVELPTDYELERKALHYPNLDKASLAQHGYLAFDVSQHCYGKAVDVGLIDLNSGTELDMGSIFDYFDPISHDEVPADIIGASAYHYRTLLKQAMQKFGYTVYEKEFWHFTYQVQEISTPMDIVISHELRGHNNHL
jgi:D-alanyl-D-alanine dipeptidase